MMRLFVLVISVGLIGAESTCERTTYAGRNISSDNIDSGDPADAGSSRPIDYNEEHCDGRLYTCPDGTMVESLSLVSCIFDCSDACLTLNCPAGELPDENADGCPDGCQEEVVCDVERLECPDGTPVFTTLEASCEFDCSAYCGESCSEWGRRPDLNNDRCHDGCYTAYESAEHERCDQTGGIWHDEAGNCGHWACGEVETSCAVSSSGCDCGPVSSFDQEGGCAPDTLCPQI